MPHAPAFLHRSRRDGQPGDPTGGPGHAAEAEERYCNAADAGTQTRCPSRGSCSQLKRWIKRQVRRPTLSFQGLPGARHRGRVAGWEPGDRVRSITTMRSTCSACLRERRGPASSGRGVHLPQGQGTPGGPERVPQGRRGRRGGGPCSGWAGAGRSHPGGDHRAGIPGRPAVSGPQPRAGLRCANRSACGRRAATVNGIGAGSIPGQRCRPARLPTNSPRSSTVTSTGMTRNSPRNTDPLATLGTECS